MTTYRDFVISKLLRDLGKPGQLVNAALGLAGEASEVSDEVGPGIAPLMNHAGKFADIVKKNFAQGRAIDRDKALSELGDVRFYLELAAWALDFEMSDVEQANVAKLEERYPAGGGGRRDG
jgi:hypothetical protein